MDETLVHCMGEKSKGAQADVFVNIRLSKTSTVEAGFNIRPGAREFLENAALSYELIIFTASQ